jgi:hypothetical protein
MHVIKYDDNHVGGFIGFCFISNFNIQEEGNPPTPRAWLTAAVMEPGTVWDEDKGTGEREDLPDDQM